MTSTATSSTLQLTVLATLIICSLFCSGVLAIRYEPRLVGGAQHLDVDGRLIKYFIFAEERAIITPTPEFMIFDYKTKGFRALSADLLTGTVRNHRTNRTQTRSMSQSLTVGNSRSSLRWFVKSAPFGALGIKGPRSWSGTGNPVNRFKLTDWAFQTAGEYNMGFNATFFDGTHFIFNWTILVNRQPAFLANGPLPFGYNGTAWSPAPIGYVQNILGITIATASVRVVFEFQAYPNGATWTGTLSKYTTTAGSATFGDIVVSVPGAYTYRMVATLSDGSTKAAPSVQIHVERALPVTITRLTSLDSMARFHIFQVPKFTIRDAIGLDYDARLNLTLRLSSDKPFYSYSGFETIAQFTGVTSVKQKQDGYTFEFPGIAFDLPGAFEVAAEIALPGGSTLSSRFIANVDPAPTFEFTQGRGTLRQNQISTMVLFGKRPPFNDILLMLASDENCTRQASDMISWPKETANTSTGDANRTFSVVPWTSGTLYPCMKLPSQSFFGGLVQNYLPQFDEQFPLITSVSVASVAECPSMTSLEALQYRVSGWDTVQAGRLYGCALPRPSSGTIPPCSCPSHLSCGSFSHAVFTPPGLDIGTCQCCATWIMAIASLVIAVVFAGLLFVVYEYV